MKLTKKGLKRLHNEAVRYIENGTICHQPIGYDQMEALHGFEFRSDEFTDCVVLTLDEAKQVRQEFLDIVCEIVRFVGRYGVKYEKPSSLIMLEERINKVGV